VTGLRLAAVDLGATSGRVILGVLESGTLELTEVHRFPNGPVEEEQRLRWDAPYLYREAIAGLRKAGPLDGIGIDSWAVDYGLLDRRHTLMGLPVHYRDSRTAAVIDRVHAKVSPTELYAVNGLQTLPFNTVYQLASETDDQLKQAETVLLIPDLLGYWLTGKMGAERTNASTTGLYDARSREWALTLTERIGISSRLLPPLRSAGTVIGPALFGPLLETPVIAVASHDTASAVIGVPAARDTRFAYISSGTWSLVGVELDEPLLTEEARLAGFSNEGGVDGTTRFLRNVMGLWVLNETVRTRSWDIESALAAAAAAPAFGPLADIDAPAFLPPGDMVTRIIDACRATGQTPPATQGEIVRCVLESLAMAYRRTLRRITELTGGPIDVVHVVGGGAHNDLLCALTANACGTTVIAGPTEATALGNVLVQARALGADLPDRWAMRSLIARSQTTRVYEPGPGADRWDAAERRGIDLGVWSGQASAVDNPR
jgi:rhamnulokinase